MVYTDALSSPIATPNQFRFIQIAAFNGGGGAAVRRCDRLILNAPLSEIMKPTVTPVVVSQPGIVTGKPPRIRATRGSYAPRNSWLSEENLHGDEKLRILALDVTLIFVITFSRRCRLFYSRVKFYCPYSFWAVDKTSHRRFQPGKVEGRKEKERIGLTQFQTSPGNTNSVYARGGGGRT